MPNEVCILCGNETTVDVNTHIDFRDGYVEGAGQLCIGCFQKSNQPNRNHIIIPENLIKDTPNDMELGAKIRQFYHNNY